MCRYLVLLHFWYDFFIPLGSCISTVQLRAGAIALLTVKEAITLRQNPDLSDLVECRAFSLSIRLKMRTLKRKLKRLWRTQEMRLGAWHTIRISDIQQCLPNYLYPAQTVAKGNPHAHLQRKFLETGSHSRFLSTGTRNSAKPCSIHLPVRFKLN